MNARMIKCRKFRVLYAVFLCCYFSYVIFPVTYAVHASEGDDSAARMVSHQKRAVKSESVRLFLSEMLLSLHRDDADDDDAVSPSAGSGRILLVKKRALSASLKYILDRLIASVVLLSGLLLLQESVVVAPAAEHETIRAVKGFHFFHSGIAPPAV